mmetsp:Transcript_10239/g.25150  ORF Transcript_10239/g.25150 Transcript_10239/m.25150 type:complete len:148 (-) Transcript_10239:163-606(-)|eukprot:CAMPEP_0181363494 /NCGR_PEP_ID=MMETSP1106-20121128/8777_1 /TAXON_ID=81844 /ORGANISM="Mantoniella antarctica, Strain SL-175" /LENGTH=147 /DNA_ID=CAMNT_0023477933 /DNA_START=174 /DNA_END=617 /DNA_ORIENTATION=+
MRSCSSSFVKPLRAEAATRAAAAAAGGHRCSRYPPVLAPSVRTTHPWRHVHLAVQAAPHGNKPGHVAGHSMDQIDENQASADDRDGSRAFIEDPEALIGRRNLMSTIARVGTVLAYAAVLTGCAHTASVASSRATIKNPEDAQDNRK